MNRKSLATVFLIAMIGVVILVQSVLAENENRRPVAESTAIQSKVERNKRQIAEATYRLGYHCKMLVVESLIISKNSINLAFDTAIDAL